MTATVFGLGRRLQSWGYSGQHRLLRIIPFFKHWSLCTECVFLRHKPTDTLLQATLRQRGLVDRDRPYRLAARSLAEGDHSERLAACSLAEGDHSEMLAACSLAEGDHSPSPGSLYVDNADCSQTADECECGDGELQCVSNVTCNVSICDYNYCLLLTALVTGRVILHSPSAGAISRVAVWPLYSGKVWIKLDSKSSAFMNIYRRHFYGADTC